VSKALDMRGGEKKKKTEWKKPSENVEEKRQGVILQEKKIPRENIRRTHRRQSRCRTSASMLEESGKPWDYSVMGGRRPWHAGAPILTFKIN